MSTLRAQPGWPDLLVDYAHDGATAQRLVAQLRACQVSALAFCRLLERWARGEATPSTPGGREAALARAAERAETALAGLEGPLGRYLLELEADQAEGRSWYGEPGQGRADRVAAGAQPRRRPRVSRASGAGVPRARGARPGSRRPRIRGANALGAGPLVPLGGPVRPPREPPERRPRRPQSPRGLIPSRHHPSHTLCCITAPRVTPFRMLRAAWEPLHEDYASRCACSIPSECRMPSLAPAETSLRAAWLPRPATGAFVGS